MESYSETNARVHYDLRLRLEPQAQYVSVSGSLVFHAPPEGANFARLYLNRQFNIHTLEGRRVEGYHYELKPKDIQQTFFPDAGLLDIYFHPPLRSGDSTLVQFEYDGAITQWPEMSANVVSRDWIEMGMYLPWFPLQFNDSPASLTFTLQVTCPTDYAVASYGEATRQGNTWYFTWPHPTTDIVIVAGRELRSHILESESNRVHLHTVALSDKTATDLGEDLLWTLERFAGWFGPIRPGEFTLIQSPRPLGGGYARRGLVVLGDLTEHEYLDQREAYLRYLAHEAAHAWWWGAPVNSWEDWLNESFAEYSALMAIRERYGNEAFQRRLERKRAQVGELLPNGALPLWGFDRSDTTTAEKQERVEAQLYHKGPLLLHDLAEQIGNARFLSLCRGMQWSEVHTTDHFLDLLEELENPSVRQWMEASLKSM